MVYCRKYTIFPPLIVFPTKVIRENEGYLYSACLNLTSHYGRLKEKTVGTAILRQIVSEELYRKHGTLF